MQIGKTKELWCMSLLSYYIYRSTYFASWIRILGAKGSGINSVFCVPEKRDLKDDEEEINASCVGREVLPPSLWRRWICHYKKKKKKVSRERATACDLEFRYVWRGVPIMEQKSRVFSSVNNTSSFALSRDGVQFGLGQQAKTSRAWTSKSGKQVGGCLEQKGF